MIDTLPPAQDLTRTVRLCWAGKGEDENTFFEVYPSAGVDLVFRFSKAGHRAVLFGPRTQTATVEIAAEAKYFGISFYCGQAPQFGTPSHPELIDKRIELTDTAPLKNLLVTLAKAEGFPARQRQMEIMIRRTHPLLQNEQCRSICAAAEEACGLIQVKELADRFGMHPRSLERMFKKQLGLTPKFMIRTIRLRNLLDAIRAGGQDDLVGLAQRFGYADQPHMIRDIKKLTGRVPSWMDPEATGRLADCPEKGIVHRHNP